MKSNKGKTKAEKLFRMITGKEKGNKRAKKQPNKWWVELEKEWTCLADSAHKNGAYKK